MRRADAALAIGDHFLFWSCAKLFEHLAKSRGRSKTLGLGIDGLRPLEMHGTRDVAASLGAHRICSGPFAIPAHVENQSFRISDRGLHVLRVGNPFIFPMRIEVCLWWRHGSGIDGPAFRHPE